MKLSFSKDRFPHLLPNIFDFVATLEEDKTYELTIEKKSEKRSNDANRYFWELVGKLSAKLRIPPEEVYRHFVKDVGGNYEVLPVRDEAVETWIKNWKSRGIGWLCETIGESKLRGYTNVICFYGSSTYDSQQFSRLIELCANECRAQGIEVMAPQELAAMVGER